MIKIKWNETIERESINVWTTLSNSCCPTGGKCVCVCVCFFKFIKYFSTNIYNWTHVSSSSMQHKQNFSLSIFLNNSFSTLCSNWNKQRCSCAYTLYNWTNEFAAVNFQYEKCSEFTVNFQEKQQFIWTTFNVIITLKLRYILAHERTMFKRFFLLDCAIDFFPHGWMVN